MWLKRLKITWNKTKTKKKQKNYIWKDIITFYTPKKKKH